MNRNASGPVVWAAIIATTCLLLFAFQKILWLVVPGLLALIIYYMLCPALQWLVLRGVTHDAAAGWVTLLFLAGLVIFGTLLTPWMATLLGSAQASIEQYVTGGLQLLERSLRAIEGHWRVLADAHFSATVMNRIAHSSDSITEHIEPIAMAIAAWTPSLLLAPFLAFFFLRDGHRFKRFLARAVPNAFFERTLNLLHEVDKTLRAYFMGLLKLTVMDTLTLALGLWLLGFPGALALGFICAVLAWIPYVGSILGGLVVVLVAATDFSATPTMAYWAIALFIAARLLDDFVYMPMTIGKSLHMHPLVTVVMIFIGGAVAGVSGLMLVLPVLGVVMVVGETIGHVVTDPRLMARHRHHRALRRKLASDDLSV
jgi:predicted PurR-regulated permease PerM